MNNIKSFEQYIKEEFYPQATKGEGGGSKWFSKISDTAGQFLGKKLGIKSDIMGGILDELLKGEKEEDVDFIKSQVNRNITQGQIEGKSDEEIREIVSKEIKNVKELNAHLLSK
jgi:hypothetical protein